MAEALVNLTTGKSPAVWGPPVLIAALVVVLLWTQLS